MVFADISKKIRRTIGFISHTNIPHTFTSTHHWNRMITIWKDDVWKRRSKLNLREETSIKWGLGFSRGAKERCNCLCPSAPRVSPHTLCDTLYNSVQGNFFALNIPQFVSWEMPKLLWSTEKVNGYDCISLSWICARYWWYDHVDRIEKPPSGGA